MFNVQKLSHNLHYSLVVFDNSLFTFSFNQSVLIKKYVHNPINMSKSLGMCVLDHLVLQICTFWVSKIDICILGQNCKNKSNPYSI